MRRATFVLLAVLVAAIAVVGCGDSDSSTVPTQAEYKQQFTAVSEQLSAVGAGVRTAVNASGGRSNKALEKTFAELADRTRAVASKIDDLTPPDDPTIKKNQAALVDGLNVAADNLEAISKAAGKKDLKAAGLAAAKLSRDDALVSGPRIALNKAVFGSAGGLPASAGGTPTTTNKE